MRSVAHWLRWMAAVAKDLILRPSYRPQDFWDRKHAKGDNFGAVALEAAVQGLPVVASRLQGIEDAVADGANGFLVPPGDAEAFAAATSRILELPDEERKELRERFWQFTLARFGWDKTAARYFEALRAALAARRQDRIAGY